MQEILFDASNVVQMMTARVLAILGQFTVMTLRWEASGCVVLAHQVAVQPGSAKILNVWSVIIMVIVLQISQFVR